MNDSPAGGKRRTVLVAGAASAIATAAPAVAIAEATVENPAALRLLASTDEINTPPRGSPEMKFSFANPLDICGL